MGQVSQFDEAPNPRRRFAPETLDTAAVSFDTEEH
jgi:hypothetical protein